MTEAGLPAASLLAVGCLLVLSPPGRPAPAAPEPGRLPWSRGSALQRRGAWPMSALLLGAAVWAWLGGHVGLVVGVVVAGAVALGGPKQAARLESRVGLADRDTAVATDLLVAALDAGLPVPAAVSAAGDALGGRLGQAMLEAARLLEVGAEPRQALVRLLSDANTARLARAVERAQRSGMAPREVLAAAAETEREQVRSTRVSRARSAGSLAALPAGLLFLPAFVLVGVVPPVVGALSGVLGAG